MKQKYQRIKQGVN